MSIGYPLSAPPSFGFAQMHISEDNAAVIQMTMKGGAPPTRTYRIDYDWVFEKDQDGSRRIPKQVGTREQMTDIFTNGNFTPLTRRSRMRLHQLMHIGLTSHDGNITTEAASSSTYVVKNAPNNAPDKNN